MKERAAEDSKPENSSDEARTFMLSSVLGFPQEGIKALGRGRKSIERGTPLPIPDVIIPTEKIKLPSFSTWGANRRVTY